MADKKQDKYSNPFTATLTGIMDLFRKHEAAGELKPTDRFDGQTVLVDGASSGLGFAVARKLPAGEQRSLWHAAVAFPGREMK
jgi:hypothetical protein